MLWIDFELWQRQDPFAGLKTDIEGGFRDNFSCLLFHLIQKADAVNKAKLRVVYPLHVALWEWWSNSEIVPTREQIKEKAAQLEQRWLEHRDVPVL